MHMFKSNQTQFPELDSNHQRFNTIAFTEYAMWAYMNYVSGVCYALCELFISRILEMLPMSSTRKIMI